MDTTGQIAFDFAAQRAVEKTDNQPVNVGVRIKVLKPVPILSDPVIETVVERPSSDSKPAVTVKSTRGRKSIKETAAEADLITVPEDEILFQKQYYSMGEVAEMFRVNHSLLRFWENEFDIIQPRKNRKGDRHFRPIDVKNLHLIYHLLRQRKYTIEGAKDFLKKNKKAEKNFETILKLQQIRQFLVELKASL